MAVAPTRGMGVKMCRSIRVLRQPAGVAAEDEIRSAALQFVRKVSGYRKPSRANEEAFDGAVEDVALAARRLLHSLAAPTTSVPQALP